MVGEPSPALEALVAKSVVDGQAVSISWELIRNVESVVLPQTHRIRNSGNETPRYSISN